MINKNGNCNTDYKKQRLDILGGLLLKIFKRHTVIEKAPWAKERVARVVEKLHRARQNQKRYKVTIPWLKAPLAFTLPGRHIFISRNFFQLCANDEQFAFIVAHEIAHHDLRHVSFALPKWFSKYLSDETYVFIWMVARSFTSEKVRHQQEFDADALALKMCVKAGYDADKCLGVFKVMENLMLDYRAIDGVFGSKGPQTWEDKAKQRIFSGVSTHPPLRARLDVLLENL